MGKMEEMTCPIPSLVEFKQLTPERQEEAYRNAYRPLHTKTIGSDHRRLVRVQLLQSYQSTAGWSKEQVCQLQHEVRKEEHV